MNTIKRQRKCKYIRQSKKTVCSKTSTVAHSGKGSTMETVKRPSVASFGALVVVVETRMKM
jgi:hypothetical protein